MSSRHPLDEDLLEALCADTALENRTRVWQPLSLAVVLGRANVAEAEVDVDACRVDQVPVQRRLGGGGAVVLGPGCVVVSQARRVHRPTAVRDHMAFGVGCIAEALGALGGPDLTVRGLGDLCVGDRKVLGSSGFRRRDVFFYQASLLVDIDMAVVERYLRHPSSEPEYRRGRSHRAFLTTLRGEGMPHTPAGVAGHLARALNCGEPAAP